MKATQFSTRIILLVLTGVPLLSNAQSGNKPNELIHEDSIFNVVERPPEYTPGGYEGLLRFISKETKYPKNTDPTLESTIFISFIVEKDGSVSDVINLRGETSAFKEETIRVIKRTKWIPGKEGGKPVRVKFVLPIRTHFDY